MDGDTARPLWVWVGVGSLPGVGVVRILAEGSARASLSTSSCPPAKLRLAPDCSAMPIRGMYSTRTNGVPSTFLRRVPWMPHAFRTRLRTV